MRVESSRSSARIFAATARSRPAFSTPGTRHQAGWARAAASTAAATSSGRRRARRRAGRGVAGLRMSRVVRARAGTQAPSIRTGATSGIGRSSGRGRRGAGRSAQMLEFTSGPAPRRCPLTVERGRFLTTVRMSASADGRVARNTQRPASLLTGACRPILPCQPREVHALERERSAMHGEIHVIGLPRQVGTEVEAKHVSHHVDDGDAVSKHLASVVRQVVCPECAESLFASGERDVGRGIGPCTAAASCCRDRLAGG